MLRSVKSKSGERRSGMPFNFPISVDRPTFNKVRSGFIGTSLDERSEKKTFGMDEIWSVKKAALPLGSRQWLWIFQSCGEFIDANYFYIPSDHGELPKKIRGSLSSKKTSQKILMRWFCRSRSSRSRRRANSDSSWVKSRRIPMTSNIFGALLQYILKNLYRVIFELNIKMSIFFKPTIDSGVAVLLYTSSAIASHMSDKKVQCHWIIY